MEEPTSTLIRPTTSDLTYDRYLKISEILQLQHPLAEPKEHDETLFIITHQAFELWFKQILHEIDYAIRAVAANDIISALKVLKRISTIQRTLTQQIDILETMTPIEFNRFRGVLNPASGFQSFQFRKVEFALGMKEPHYLKFHEQSPAIHAELVQALRQPSLWDYVLAMLIRRGLPVDADVLQKPVDQPYTPHESVLQAIQTIYLDTGSFNDLYMLCESLVDVDENFLLWRYRHVVMVARMIGDHRGTGGSSGVNYLSSTLSKRFFPEIWQVRSHLQPK